MLVRICNDLVEDVYYPGHDPTRIPLERSPQSLYEEADDTPRCYPDELSLKALEVRMVASLSIGMKCSLLLPQVRPYRQ